MSDWNTQIIEKFRANGGKVDGMYEGAPLLLLTTTGKKSGKLAHDRRWHISRWRSYHCSCLTPGSTEASRLVS